MRFRDRPLLVDGVDAGLYLDRPELERRLVEPLAAGRNVLLLGDIGFGKSTLLRRAASLLADQGRPAVVVNAALADDAAGLLDLVAVALDERLAPGGTAARDERLSPGGASPPPAPGLLGAARRLRRDVPVAILVDGLIDETIGYDVFGRVRDELWSLGHAWAVAVRPRDSAALRKPPVDAFWSAVVEIEPLAPAEVDRLLRLGLTEEELGRVDPRDLTGSPRSVIRAAQDVLSGASTNGAGGREHLRRASTLGRSEAMAVAELQGLGRPVSTRDPELLDRLRWSRPYAQRILAHLEDKGLVRSIPERSDRPGRPRKLYELNPNLPAA